MEINPDKDLSIDVTNLHQEFRMLPTVLFAYYRYKAAVEEKRDIAKAKLKEVRALSYKRIKSDIMVKHTEKSIEAEIDCDPQVLIAQTELIKAEHDASTWGGAVDSMKAKKDMLMQIGADARKER